jgi:outer membrane protein OmpA-like peptidoglycan-associated protein
MLHSLRLLLFVCCTLAAGVLAAQGEEGLIFLNNPSFEDLARNSQPPRGWTNCGAPGETPPDVHPDPEFLFRVGMKAQHEKTFLGMVTRDTETWESVGQQLAQPFVANQCYRLDIQLARSLTYLSMSRMTKQPTNYVTPIRLRVWGGYSVCDRAQLLGSSGLVSNSDWRQYNIKLSPEDDFTHIILEAYYPEAILLATNGNVLLDNARPMFPIDCDDEAAMLTEPPLADGPEPTNPANEIVLTEVPERTEPKVYKGPPNAFVPKAPQEPTVRLGQTEAILKEGEVFTVENISFKSNSAELEEESEDALQEIVGFLKENNNVIVEIGGHASRMATSFYASDLSSNRAKTVVAYLKRNNIGFERLLSKGYGKSKPVCMDNTKDCNRRNQRVEVKILKIKRSK